MKTFKIDLSIQNHFLYLIAKTARFGLTGSFIDSTAFRLTRPNSSSKPKLQRQRHAMLQNDHRDILARIQRAMPAAFGVVATRCLLQRPMVQQRLLCNNIKCQSICSCRCCFEQFSGRSCRLKGRRSCCCALGASTVRAPLAKKRWLLCAILSLLARILALVSLLSVTVPTRRPACMSSALVPRRWSGQGCSAVCLCHSSLRPDLFPFFYFLLLARCFLASCCTNSVSCGVNLSSLSFVLVERHQLLDGCHVRVFDQALAVCS
jgi:hypothetical protein